MIRKKPLICLAVFALIGVVFCLFSGIVVALTTAQSDRALSFVTDGLIFDPSKFLVSEGGEWAYASYINDTYTVMNGTNYAVSSENSNLSVACVYPSKGDGLWFVALTTDRTSTELPLCAQTSANVTDRARDFLERYQNWTGNSTFTAVINMLDSVDAATNMTISKDNMTLTVASNLYCVSFYWEYTINGTDYRGLGVAIAGKHLFFRDDQNLPFLPQQPPTTIFTSSSPYGLGVEFPESGATNVPVNTNFTMTTTRPALVELYLNPGVEVANVVSETIQFSGHYTFLLAQQLQPNTTYIATLVYGQIIPADFDSAPISIKSWSFTTGNSTTAAEPISPVDQNATNFHSLPPVSTRASLEGGYPFPFSTVLLVVLIMGIGVAIVVGAILLYRKE